MTKLAERQFDIRLFSSNQVPEALCRLFSSDKWEVDFVGGPFQKDQKPTQIDNQFILS